MLFAWAPTSTSASGEKSVIQASHYFDNKDQPMTGTRAQGIDSPLRVAIVVNRFPSVSESFIFRKVLGLQARGFQIKVLAQSPDNDRNYFEQPLAQNAISISINPLAVGLTRIPLTLSRLTLRGRARVRNLLLQAITHYGVSERALRAWMLALPLVVEGFDVIHFELSGIAVSYLDALPLLKPAKIVVSCRGSSERITPLVKAGRAADLWRMFAAVDRIHCVTADMLAYVGRYGVHSERGFVNRPAIDDQLFRRSSPATKRQDNHCRLLSVGRLHWVKGLEYGLLALKTLVERGYDAHYTLIGGGPEEERLRFMVHTLGLQSNVNFRGSLPASEVRVALEAADIYLLPSLSEGLSNAALEAMAMELPVVATRVGGMDEAIQDGVEGYLTPTWDADALAEKISLLIDNPELRHVMGQSGRRRVEAEFTISRQIDVFIDEYRCLVKNGN